MENIIDENDEIGDIEYLNNLPDDLILPKASYDPKYMHLQKLVTDFVTDFIMKNERDLFNHIDDVTTVRQMSMEEKINFREKLIGTNNIDISKLIIDGYTIFFNKLHKQIKQSKIDDKNIYYADKVNCMLEVCGYNISILIIKLHDIITDINLDITRENLNLDTLDEYLETIGKEINHILIDRKLILELIPNKNDISDKREIPIDADLISVTYKNQDDKN